MTTRWRPPWLIRLIELTSGLNVIFAVVAMWAGEWWHGAGHLVFAAVLWVIAVWLTRRTGHAPPS
jgi:hypothetical protein